MGRSERAKSVVKKETSWQEELAKVTARLVAEASDKAYKSGFFMGQAMAGAELYEAQDDWERLTATIEDKTNEGKRARGADR